jgi:hypothetical protein
MGPNHSKKISDLINKIDTLQKKINIQNSNKNISNERIDLYINSNSEKSSYSISTILFNHGNKEFEETNGVITFPNFYLDYQNTQNGFSLNIINKYKFENENNIVYTKLGKDLMCSTKHGKYKITEDFIMTGFDTEFKNYLLSKGFEGDQIDLKEFNELIEREEKKSSCCLII